MSINRTRVLFCDLLNLPRGKYVPADVAKSSSIGFARAAYAVTFDRDLLPVPGCGVHDGLPDMQLNLDQQRARAGKRQLKSHWAILRSMMHPLVFVHARSFKTQ